MNMDVASIALPPPKIKVEDDDPDIIDLEKDKTPEDLVYEWHAKVRLKLKDYYVVESEGTLDTLMKWYIQTLKEDAESLEDFQNLKILAMKHLQFFKLYFVDLNCCFVDNYLDNMEEILTVFSNIEIKSLPKKRKDGAKRAFKKFLSSICRKIISTLNLYLMNKEDRMCHVMMKIKLNSLSEESKELLNLLYGKFLTKEPKDKSDLAFCRAYILYQRWKTIRKPEDWEKMDEVMYNLYDRTPESIKSNATLKRILLPQSHSVLDALIHISEKHIIICEEYFKYVTSLKIQEDSVILPELNDIDINDPVVPDLNEDDEDREFNLAYNNFVQSMAALPQEKGSESSGECVDVKLEDDDDDDCQIVAVSSITGDAGGAELVHEILDDDDIEIIYFKKKDNQAAAQKEKKDNTPRSFLDSIDISDKADLPTEKVSSSTNTCPSIHRTSVSSSVTTSATTTTATPLLECKSSVHDVVRPVVSVVSHQPSESVGDASIANSESEHRTTETLQLESSPVKTVNMETQTEDFSQNVGVNSSSSCHCSQKGVESLHSSDRRDGSCGSYYYYGLVTPPSDLPSDEHNVPTADASTYPNVYANIVRTRNSQDEIDSIANISESDYLVSSAEENLPKDSPVNSEMEKSDSLVEREKDDQNNLRSDEESNTGYEMECESYAEADIKKGSEDGGACSNQCDSLPETTTEAAIVDNADRQDGSKEIEAAFNHDSNLVSGSCSPGISLNLPSLSPIRDANDSSIGKPSFGDLRSPSPKKYDRPTSPGIHCTSTAFVIPPTLNNPSNAQVKSVNLPCPSPDITSTSTDIQDFNKGPSSREEDNAPAYEGLNNNVSETEGYLDNGGYCSEEYLNYGGGDLTSNENVSQSNLEDGEASEEIFIEDPVLMNNEEELSFIIGEALPIGANVNISIEETTDGGAPPERPEAEKQTAKAVDSALPLSESKQAAEDKSDRKIDKTVSSSKKIMYTCSERVRKHTVDEFSIFEETIQLRWNKLKETHNLDEIFTGPISKVNGISNCVNPDTNFDLFGSRSVSEEQAVKCSAANSSGEVTSPPYEGIDDFRSYYEENKNNSMLDAPLPKKPADRVPTAEKKHPKDNANGMIGQIHARDVRTLQNGHVVPNADRIPKPRPPNSVKRMRIAFAKEVLDSSNVVSHSPVEGPPQVLQGILKKPSSDGDNHRHNGKRTATSAATTTRPRIPRRLMNLRSLAQYNVRPNDPCIQGLPCVVIERLSDGEISQWLRVSEISRKIRLQKLQANAAHSVFRVDYDKETTHISEKDMVRYSTSEGVAAFPLPQTTGHWRSNSVLQARSGGLDEGFKSNELPYTEKKNGKRKRQGSVYPQSSKKHAVFREASETTLESSGIKKTSRKRKNRKRITIQ